MANALVGSFLAKLGLNDDAIVFITSAPPDYLNWLDIDSARKLGIDVMLFENGKLTPSWAQTKSDVVNSRRAVINFHKRYAKLGIGGLIDSVRSCYAKVFQKPDIKIIEYCLVLDWSAVSFDKSMSQLMKWPRQEYFEDHKAIERFRLASKVINWKSVEPKTFYIDTTALAEKLVNDEAVISAAKH
jgi:hypothetical protein